MNAFHAHKTVHSTAHQASNTAAQRRTRLGFAAAALCTTLVLFQAVALLASPSIEPAVQLAATKAAVKAAPAATTALAQEDDNWSRNFASVVPSAHAPKGPLEVAGLSAARANLR